MSLNLVLRESCKCTQCLSVLLHCNVLSLYIVLCCTNKMMMMMITMNILNLLTYKSNFTFTCFYLSLYSFSFAVFLTECLFTQPAVELIGEELNFLMVDINIVFLYLFMTLADCIAPFE